MCLVFIAKMREYLLELIYYFHNFYVLPFKNIQSESWQVYAMHDQ